MSSHFWPPLHLCFVPTWANPPTAAQSIRPQCRTQSIFGDTVFSCYCKLRLVTPHGGGLRGRKFLILITLDRWKKHFREKNYIENYFYVLKSTKSTKTTSQKCWRNIIWADFLVRPYRTNGIKTRLGWPVPPGDAGSWPLKKSQLSGCWQMHIYYIYN